MALNFSWDSRATLQGSGSASSISRYDNTTSLAINIDNAESVLIYEPQFKIIICKEHCYAIRNLKKHLQEQHAGNSKDKLAVVQAYAKYELVNPRDVAMPLPLLKPFDSLGQPRKAYICDEEECEFISINRSKMGEHCNKSHNWRSNIADKEHWHQVFVQTFFSTGGFQKYFTVDYDEQRGGQGQPSGLTLQHDDQVDIALIEEEWKQAKQKHEKELEIIDGEVAKQDRTLWFKQTGWVEHLAKSNVKHLAYASRLPDKDEWILQQAAKILDILLERCVSGLSTLDKETRRWLRSAKRNEPDIRPIARLQNKDSQFRYSGYWKRFICYCLRVYIEQKKREGEEQSEGDNSDSGDSESSEDEGSDYPESIEEERLEEDDTNDDINKRQKSDVMFDACRLFPWRDDQKILAEKLWQSIEARDDEKNQVEIMLQLCTSFIFQSVRGDMFISGLMHFLAVLGIDEDTNRLKQANDYSINLETCTTSVVFAKFSHLLNGRFVGWIDKW